MQTAQKTSNQTFLSEINFIKNQHFTKFKLNFIYFLLNKYFTKYLVFTKLHPSKRDAHKQISRCSLKIRLKTHRPTLKRS